MMILVISDRVLNDKSKENIVDRIRKIPENFKIWLVDKQNRKFTPHEIGVGISQVLPVVVAAIFEKNLADDMKKSISIRQLIAIEQPELHIHPALQVELGDLFITESSENKFFLIETHSEHLILRLMRRIREGKIEPDDVNVIFIELTGKGRDIQLIKLRLDEDGDFIDEWPGGFFEESFHEKFAGR